MDINEFQKACGFGAHVLTEEDASNVLKNIKINGEILRCCFEEILARFDQFPPNEDISYPISSTTLRKIENLSFALFRECSVKTENDLLRDDVEQFNEEIS